MLAKDVCGPAVIKCVAKIEPPRNLADDPPVGSSFAGRGQKCPLTRDAPFRAQALASRRSACTGVIGPAPADFWERVVARVAQLIWERETRGNGNGVAQAPIRVEKAPEKVTE